MKPIKRHPKTALSGKHRLDFTRNSALRMSPAISAQIIYSVVERIAVAAAQHTPQNGRLGVFCRDAEPQQSSGIFFWFDDIKALQHFMGEVLIAFHKPDALIIQSTVRATDTACSIQYTCGTRQIDSDILIELIPDLSSASASERESRRLALNILLQGIVEIMWWGTYADIAAGEDDFACDVRRRFQEGTRKSWLTSEALPITPSEQMSFRRFLLYYGE